MFFTYLRKELTKRKRNTFIIAIGIALAVTLVVMMSSISNGVSASQAKALQAVYGVGTDITVSKATTTASATTGQKFNFGAADGSSSGSTSTLSQSSLSLNMGTTAFTSANLAKVTSAAHVSAATGILLLRNNSFSGQVPTQQSGSSTTQQGQAPGSNAGSTATRPTGGPDGAGGSSFAISNFSVAGVSATTSVGPLSSVTVKSGRLLTSADTGKYNVVLDSNYATSASKKVGSTIKIDGKSFKVVGIVTSSASSTTETVANTYIPLDVAQKLSGQTNKLTTIYVKANSASNIAAIQSELKSSLSGLTVNTQSSLASTVTGAVSTASNLLSTFGLWIVIGALAAAFLLSILFTISGVTRRTRELGTLKSIGWRNSRIMAQISAEAVTQALLGGLIGSGLGVAGVAIINAIKPTITAAAAATSGRGPGGPEAASAASNSIQLQAILTPEVIGYALALAVIGGILAGIIGSWRAAHLRPVEALRSV